MPGSTGCWRDWQEGPGAELRLGALPPDSLGPPSLCCLCSTQHTHANIVVHTCTDTLIHPHMQLHAHAR